MAGTTLSPVQRFWNAVIVRGSDECWLWTASTNGDGYGLIRVDGTRLLAHRYSYILHKGPIAHGLEVLHSCNNPPCVNPKHLRAGTRSQNALDAYRDGLMEAVREASRGRPRDAQGRFVTVGGT